MEGGWAAAAQFQQPVAWDLSTPCVGVDTRQGDAKQFGGDGGGGRLQTFGAGSAERPVRDQVLSYVTIASQQGHLGSMHSVAMTAVYFRSSESAVPFMQESRRGSRRGPRRRGPPLSPTRS